MLVHLVRIAALAAALLVCVFRPFLPGVYDGLAVTLSFMAQLVGFAGLLLVPIGALWWAADAWSRILRKRALTPITHGFYFAIAAFIAASLVVVVATFPAFANVGWSFGLLTLSLWILVVWKLAPGLKRLRQGDRPAYHPAPLYLIGLPLTVLLFRWALIEPATEYSRNHAIAQSADLIRDIEAYRAVNGHYPRSLASVWKDYRPSVIGIQQYHYEPAGDAYNLFFEQFTFQLDTREVVVFNPLDEQVITSHDSWILLLSPSELSTTRGFYAVHDAAIPKWKYFWFD